MARETPAVAPAEETLGPLALLRATVDARRLHRAAPYTEVQALALHTHTRKERSELGSERSSDRPGTPIWGECQGAGSASSCRRGVCQGSGWAWGSAQGGVGVALLTRIFRKGAGDANISPLHHACLSPCHPMSFICSFTLSRRLPFTRIFFLPALGFYFYFYFIFRPTPEIFQIFIQLSTNQVPIKYQLINCQLVKRVRECVACIDSLYAVCVRFVRQG